MGHRWVPENGDEREVKERGEERLKLKKVLKLDEVILRNNGEYTHINERDNVTHQHIDNDNKQCRRYLQ
jgi:hypothetical protein